MIFAAYEVALAGLIGIILGSLIGNRLAIGRDRRAEWNKITTPFYARLLEIRKNTALDLPDGWEVAFDVICMKLPGLKQRGFRNAVSAYKESKGPNNQNQYDPEIGGPVCGGPFRDVEAIVKAVEALILYLRPIK